MSKHQKRWLSTREVAEEFGYTTAQLSKWRSRMMKDPFKYCGLGPAWCIRGGNVRYLRGDVERYVAKELYFGKPPKIKRVG